MKIRNTREVTLLVPSAHVVAAPDEVIDWPARRPIPDGFVEHVPARRTKSRRPADGKATLDPQEQ